MSEIEGTSTRRAALSGDAARARKRRASLFAAPIALISAIAVSLNFAAPADAAPGIKPNLKPRAAIPTPKITAKSLAVAASPAPSTYVVVEGDTVSGIAARYGLSTAAVLAQNGLGWSATIFPGQQLSLGAATPVTTTVPAQPSSEIARYTVTTGDTISGIAEAHGLSAQSVLSANGLDSQSLIFPGQVITLPDAAPAAPAAISPSAPSAGSHTVIAGDTVSGIADAAGVSVQSLLDANGLGWSSIIYPGQSLTLPGHAAPSAVATDQRTVRDPAAVQRFFHAEQLFTDLGVDESIVDA